LLVKIELMPFDFAGSSAELCNETAQNMPPSFSSSTVSHGHHVPGTFRSQLTRRQPFRLARSTGITVNAKPMQHFLPLLLA
jgi:hypothetical protein